MAVSDQEPIMMLTGKHFPVNVIMGFWSDLYMILYELSIAEKQTTIVGF